MNAAYGKAFGAVVAIFLAAAACKSEPESEPPPEPDPVVEEQSDDEEQELKEHLQELYGLPLPPNYDQIKRREFLVRVTTESTLEEVREFFEKEAVDAEVFEVNGRIEVVPLRTHAGRASAHWYGGRHGHTVIHYTRPPGLGDEQLQARADVDDDSDDESVPDDSPAFERTEPLRLTEPKLPRWVETQKGEPVEIRDANGDLIAPGAKWGEPYTPPEGSHLHQERYRHLWGTPYGAW